MKNLVRRFWEWYEKFYALNLSITAGLFALQLAHLYWLSTHVVLFRLLGTDYFFTHSPVVTFLIIIADYTEIPAIIATSIFYIAAFRREKSRKALLYLFLVNSQWIHLLWITDEVCLGYLWNRGEWRFLESMGRVGCYCHRLSRTTGYFRHDPRSVPCSITQVRA